MGLTTCFGHLGNGARKQALAQEAWRRAEHSWRAARGGPTLTGLQWAAMGLPGAKGAVPSGRPARLGGGRSFLIAGLSALLPRQAQLDLSGADPHGVGGDGHSRLRQAAPVQ